MVAGLALVVLGWVLGSLATAESSAAHTAPDHGAIAQDSAGSVEPYSWIVVPFRRSVLTVELISHELPRLRHACESGAVDVLLGLGFVFGLWYVSKAIMHLHRSQRK